MISEGDHTFILALTGEDTSYDSNDTVNSYRLHVIITGLSIFTVMQLLYCGRNPRPQNWDVSDMSRKVPPTCAMLSALPQDCNDTAVLCLEDPSQGCNATAVLCQEALTSGL